MHQAEINWVKGIQSEHLQCIGLAITLALESLFCIMVHLFHKSKKVSLLNSSKQLLFTLSKKKSESAKAGSPKRLAEITIIEGKHLLQKDLSP